MLNTLGLKPEIAERYAITRGPDRAMLNVSALNKQGVAQAVDIEASYENLLGQRFELPMREIREAQAIYYIGELKYTDQEVLRFTVAVQTADGPKREVQFQQRVYLEPE